MTKSEAPATQYDEALALANGDGADMAQVRRLLKAAISTGDARAEYALATWYLHGTHVKKNMARGIDLLTHAADKGVAEALFDLAVCYERGLGVPKQDAKAFGLYKAAADKGDAAAKLEVGRMLYYGIGVPADRQAAEPWLGVGDERRKIIG